MVALELAEELDDLSYENRVVALALGFDGSEDPSFPPLVRSVGLGPSVRIACSWRLRRLVERERFDAVLAHGGLPVLVVALGIPRGGPALVWQRILGFPEQIRRPARRAVWRLLARHVDGAVALTDDEADELRWLGFRGPIRVIGNFRRPQRFLAVDRDREARVLRAHLGLPDSTPLIGFIGHLVEQKRPERSLDVLTSVHAAGQDAHLVVVGDGPLRASLENDVRQRGLDTSVTFLGHRDDVERVFGAADLVIVTSEAEGIPGVVIEAGMTACPVVTFPVGAVGQVVVDGVTGVVLSRPDTALMAEAVTDLLRDPRRRVEMGSAAHARAPEFSASESAKLYGEFVAECVAIHQ